ncbi:hypothetical protein A3H03_01895 [Candidatus Kuenenbacteria bacterium RIFCSPLOWO2_12_FULL_42_13]|uniref:Polymerase nucleotidyl transferase domain-containing protein n=3 Tax=Candidatus Kueneniibacteriota TaxID=1752740 RepID=A0A0G1BX87_9BACT|nr:MAG: hypothetical protein UV02_C0021G0013 [Candidatus Kuenenbacteria bacterium GW2011_GWA2_42_15]OGG89651.1 MAG: hypothetical protein A3C68_01475 [Candidatus Kuenenbacteria bacterium RIFCSPHIGHO2_02_FULL_42_29]OGG91001.1 MAG: hypothetical protein A3H55_01150 [Candidatus Kuenenbacteria bacterium RIFCSPLOWO2_02_FULL_42_16]OGG91336.1 MAG: hypothetical protein A3H03_01895 [Candidatus Kuenenbacteria bacterium RIFCSPLOWO2_12_FULL_42_13]
MNADLGKAIFLTISYFDFFDYPLGAGEIFKWLFWNKKETLGGKDARAAIDVLVGRSKIVLIDDFYFLPGREDIINLREKREQVSYQKIRKARRMARLLGFIPFIKMIAIVSNLGYLNADKEADIDLFIVAEKGKIWAVRFWSVMLMKILGQRPSKKGMKDKICLSYYVSADNLNLEKTKVGEPDAHLCYLVAQYLPIYSEDDMWPRFVEANKWLNEYLPNFKYGESDRRFIIKPKLVWLKNLIAKTELGFEQRFYKEIQMRKMPAELKQAMHQGDKKVIVNDQMLKLHLNDKREEINSIISNFSAQG